jgi:hypothetical protein
MILPNYKSSAALLVTFLISAPAFAGDPPSAQISNGQITAKIYLPDAKNGYYRSTRFDWSGAVYSLQYKGHEFYGAWYDRVDPTVINWVHRGPEIVSGPCSALMGPVNEFAVPLGWNEAQAGGTFIKLGVGVLRKPDDARYNQYRPYDVLDPGKRSVKKTRNSVEFTQELSAPDLGYAYVYRKTVRLTPGKPEMTIEHSIRNTGHLAIHSTVYNHNFVVLDKQAPGPDFNFQVPFRIQTGPAPQAAANSNSAQPTTSDTPAPRPPRPPNGLTEVQGNRVVYRKQLSGQDEAAVPIRGFSDSAKDSEVIIENRKVGAGVKINVDRPLTRELLWSVRTVLAVEPYIAVDVEPGAEFTWTDTLDYYTMPPTP